MLITTTQLKKDKLTLDESIPAGDIEYTPDVAQVGPLTIRGKAELLEEDRGRGEVVDDIRLRATISGNFEQLCARCLEPVPQSVESEFDLIYRPAGVDAEPGERAITEEETEIGYYEKSGLLLEDAIREQVLLTLPGRVLCQEDCQGPVLKDGRRPGLDDAEAEDSSEEPVDPRWKGLAGLQLKTKA